MASIVLPLVAGWCWPRSYGPSIEAFPLLLGVGLAGVMAIHIRRLPAPGLTIWLATIVIAIALRGSPYAQYNLMLIPVAFGAWIALGLGASARLNQALWHALMWAVLVAAGLNLAVAVLQFFDLESALYPFASLNGSNRPYGNLRQPNHLATLLVIAIAVLWWGRAERKWSMAWVAPAALTGAWGIALTGSRIGLVEIAAVAILAVFWRRSIDRAGLALFAALPIAVLLFSPVTSMLAVWAGVDTLTAAQRLASGDTQARWLHWSAAWHLIEQHPWQGVGWREFRFARFADRPQDTQTEMAENAHNVVLHLAAELGLPLALLILVPFGVFLVRGLLRSRHDVRRQWGLLVLAAVSLHSLVEYPLWYMNFIFVACLAAGAVASDRPLPAMPLRRPMRFASLAMVILVGIALVDYDRVAAAYGRSVWWQSTDRQAALEQAQKTLFFAGYADYALVTQVPVTQDNYPAMIRLTDRLMHFGPDPAILEASVMARCAAGDAVAQQMLRHSFETAFPTQYAEFVARLSGALREHCGI